MLIANRPLLAHFQNLSNSLRRKTMVNKASKLLRLIVLLCAIGGVIAGISTGQQASFAQVPVNESDPWDGSGDSGGGWKCPVESYEIDGGEQCIANGCVKKCGDCTFTCRFNGKKCPPLMMCTND
jgi:hypothetical protein